MKKYILLVFPLIFYGQRLWVYFRDVFSYLPFIIQILLHLAIILVCMIFLLRRTRLKMCLIGSLVSVFLCIFAYCIIIRLNLCFFWKMPITLWKT